MSNRPSLVAFHGNGTKSLGFLGACQAPTENRVLVARIKQRSPNIERRSAPALTRCATNGADGKPFGLEVHQLIDPALRYGLPLAYSAPADAQEPSQCRRIASPCNRFFFCHVFILLHIGLGFVLMTGV
jgi:hypothetical protein